MAKPPSPPPTKYGSPGPPQAVPRPARVPVAPPPTGFGATAQAVSRAPVIQAKVPFTFTQWCAANGVNLGTISDKRKEKLYRRYFAMYVRGEAERAQSGFARLDYTDGNATTAKAQFETSLDTVWAYGQTKRRDRNITQQIANIDAFVADLNDLQSYLPKTYLEDSSSRYARAGWDGVSTALAALEGAVDNGLPRKSPRNGIQVPGIRWNRAQGILPKTLLNLISDIRTAHRNNIVFDERNRTQLTQKDDAPDTPGALRSWHWNEQGALPANAIGTHVSALHTHYQANSKPPFNGTSTLTGPIGYAEYTGTGIVDDKHNSKLVYDYVNDVMYITVTHYQRYDVVDGKYEVRNKTSGANSAWFYLKF